VEFKNLYTIPFLIIISLSLSCSKTHLVILFFPAIPKVITYYTFLIYLLRLYSTSAEKNPYAMEYIQLTHNIIILMRNNSTTIISVTWSDERDT